jgi:selenide,water dikinase
VARGRLLLAGGGHSHVEVLRRYAQASDPALSVTLVSPTPLMPYSGMLPGVVAGHYAFEDAVIALPPLAKATGARFVQDRVASIDFYKRIAALASGTLLPFDLLSLDVGSVPGAGAKGVHEHVAGVKPVEQFVQAWTETLACATRDGIGTLAVVGGGAAGVEIVLAMRYRLHKRLGGEAPRCALVTDQPTLLAQHAPGVRRRLGRLLVARDVVLHLDSAVVAVERNAVVTAKGKRIAADRIFWPTSASAAPWFAQSGLGCDERGFVRVNDFLQSVTHPFVFASGDCASQQGPPYPKSGLYAVRQGPTVATNLRRYRHDVPMIRFVPPARALALITTGDARGRPFVRPADRGRRMGLALERPHRPALCRPIPDRRSERPDSEATAGLESASTDGCDHSNVPQRGSRPGHVTHADARCCGLRADRQPAAGDRAEAAAA